MVKVFDTFNGKSTFGNTVTKSSINVEYFPNKFEILAITLNLLALTLSDDSFKTPLISLLFICLFLKALTKLSISVGVTASSDNLKNSNIRPRV